MDFVFTGAKATTFGGGYCGGLSLEKSLSSLCGFSSNVSPSGAPLTNHLLWGWLLIERIKRLLTNRESTTLEFKEAKNTVPKNLFETVCGFLNLMAEIFC